MIWGRGHTKPKRACTLSKSVRLIVSSENTDMAFLKYSQARSLSFSGFILSEIRYSYAKARITLMAAHQAASVHVCWVYCHSRSCINVPWWKMGNRRLDVLKKSCTREKTSALDGSGLKTVQANRSWKTSARQ